MRAWAISEEPIHSNQLQAYFPAREKEDEPIHWNESNFPALYTESMQLL